MDNQLRNKKYLDYVNKRLPKTKWFPSLLWAFLVGGIICVIGQGIFDAGTALFDFDKETAQRYSLIILIFLASLLTGLGVYDQIGTFAGAGSIIPITGFSNSIASPAMEFKNEGIIFGLSVKMFTVAGPVIVNGVAASILVGIVYYIMGVV
ncbi:MAG: stage V sporulation protein AC [Christensenellaceae bacterium]|jgi:stage V sporulation protein AC|nr:stage V sporulation protein AC [Christensenellaceae bacterium]